MKNFSLQNIGLFLGPIAFLAAIIFIDEKGMGAEAKGILSSTLWIAIWWITEAIPIAATSLLPILLFPLTGGLDLGSTTASYGHRLVFLYLGGFIIALSIERWNLHKRIALNIINMLGTNMSRIILGFMIATAFLSMWISNTATSVMMLPIGLAIVMQLQATHDSMEESQKFGKALMLGIAYSASIGGIATLIGTPPNLVLAGVVHEIFEIEITFAQWMLFGMPISIILLFICWKYLVNFAYPMGTKSFSGGQLEIKQQLEKLGKLSYEEKVVSIIFALTAFAWISRSFLLSKFFPAIDDTIIAIAGAIILFLIPSRSRSPGRLIDWEATVRLPWGIILLFGGGMALAEGFKSSGLAQWIGQQMTLLNAFSAVMIILVIIAAVNFLTEMTSNLATTSMILPILAPMAIIIDMHPFALMVGATVAASCAFMLPVATPPNAVVFGSGYIKMQDMVKTGFWLNLISIFIILFFVYLVLGLVWDIDISTFPESLK